MKTSRDDSVGTCAQCGTHLPARPGGGRRADYCSRACQGKAYRARLAQRTESTRDDSQWSALTARATAAEAEAESLREQLAAARRRVGELETLLQASKGTAEDRREPKLPAAATSALPAQIRLTTPRRCEQIGTAAWTVHVDDVPIGNVRMLSGQYWPTLPNGFEVYLGGAADNLDDAADKLARAYNGWANYWHAETAARLELLRPQRDGARTVKWGGLTIGKVNSASAAGYGGQGTIAITPKNGALGGRGQGPTRFDDKQHAAEALLKQWHADNTPPWGGLTVTEDQERTDRDR